MLRVAGAADDWRGRIAIRSILSRMVGQRVRWQSVLSAFPSPSLSNDRARVHRLANDQRPARSSSRHIILRGDDRLVDVGRTRKPLDDRTIDRGARDAAYGY